MATSRFISNLDPRIKFLLSLILIMSVFVASSFWQLFTLSIGIILINLFASSFLRSLKILSRFLFFFILIILLPAFFDSGFILFRLGNILIFQEGLFRGFYRASQFALLIMITSSFNSVTSIIDIADGVSMILRPQGKPIAHQIAITFSITLNFMPIFQAEAHRILAAQSSRGAYFHNNLIKRSFQMLPLLVPIFTSVLRKADWLTSALDARGYNSNLQRTHFVSLKIKKHEWILLFGAISLLIFTLIMRWI